MKTLLHPPKPKLEVPETIHRTLLLGACLAVSISGGKDSQAMLRALSWLFKHMGYPGKIFAVFADLGRIEWWGTYEHCQRICKDAGVELVVVKRPQGGMVERWEQRLETIAAKSENKPHWSSAEHRCCTSHLKTNQVDKLLRNIPQIGDSPPWSDSSNRFCTSDLKRGQIDKVLREHRLVICAVGIRAQESDSRQYNPNYCVRSNVTTESLKEPQFDTSDKMLKARMREEYADEALDRWIVGGMEGRLAFTWNAIFNWDIEQVWQQCGTSSAEIQRRSQLYKDGRIREALEGCTTHWVYCTGNSRLSCSMCVLSNKFDCANGSAHNISVWLELVEMELRSGWSFKKGSSLYSLLPHVGSMSHEQRYQLWCLLKELRLVNECPVQIAVRVVFAMSVSLLLGQWLFEVFQELQQVYEIFGSDGSSDS
jgi:3'-phosphoadenosine 5'-phosphosulfate sulfotransferase (PAPS reductase)/FAD synthetase